MITMFGYAYFLAAVIFLVVAIMWGRHSPDLHREARRNERLKLHARLRRHRLRTLRITRPNWRAKYDEMFGVPV